MTTRLEKVVLSLQDDFSTGMARAAAATALFDKELRGLSGTEVRTSRDSDRVRDAIKGAGEQSTRSSRQFDESGRSIDRYSGRMRLLVEAAATLGPALVPIGAVAIPAITGLAAGFGAAAGAAGVAVLAFNGVGDAIKAIDTYNLTPTTENLQKMQIELDKLGPAGAEFAKYLDALEPTLRELQGLAREGLFPGVEKGIDSLLNLLPQVRTIVAEVSAEMGRLSAEAGAGLAGPGFSEFFNYIQSDAVPTLDAFAHTVGNVVQGMGSLLVAFAPLSRDFASGMERMSAAFADWSAGLADTQGFRDFTAYIRQSAPQVLHLLGALGEAFVGIIQAAAPVGDLVVPALTALAKAIGAIANSPLGGPLFTAAAAMIALSRASSLLAGSMGALGVSAAAGTKAMRGFNIAAGITAGVLVGASAIREIQRATDDAVPGINALTRSLLELQGGQVQSLGKDFDDLGQSIDRIANKSFEQKATDFLQTPFKGIFGEAGDLREATADVNQLDAALAGLVQQGAAKQAAQALADIGKAQGLTGSQMSSLLRLLPQYHEALAGQANQADLAAGANRGYATSIGKTRSEIQGMVSAMEQQRTAALAAFDAVTQWGQALDAAKKQASSADKGINEMTAAGQRNRAALSQLAAAWNSQGSAVRDNLGKYAAARQALISTAMQMGVTRQRANALANELMDIPKFIQVRVEAATDSAKARIREILIELGNIPRSISTQYYVNQVNSISKRYVPGAPPGSADGSTVPKDGGSYADRYPYLLAPGEEVISNKYGQADRNRALLKAINAGRLATGGTAGWPTGWGSTSWNMPHTPPPNLGNWLHQILAAIRGAGGHGGFSYSLADQSAIVQVQQQIRDLTKQLNAHGKNKLEGLDRKAAELNLKLAQQQLADAKNAPVKALRDALSGGFNVDQALGKQPTNPIASAVHDSLAQFKQQILDAGGVWTKHLRDLSTKTIAQAMAIDKDNRAIDAATTALGNQQQTLSDLTSQMDSLTSTMSQFGSSVSGNFLTNPFGLGGQSSGGGGGGSSTFQPTVDNTPALSAATDQLNAAKAHLAALSVDSGDVNTRLANAFAAQGVASDVSKLQAQVDQLSQPVETATSSVSGMTDSLQAFKATLLGDTKNALDFNAALTTLAGEGLNMDLFSQLAQSGDTMLATELAAAGQSAVADVNSLWTQRAAAAAQVAAYATQTVYGQQQAILQGQITQQNVLITRTQASLDSLNAQVATLGQRVENGAAAGVKGIQAQIDAVAASVAAIPRQIKHASKR